MEERQRACLRWERTLCTLASRLSENVVFDLNLGHTWALMSRHHPRSCCRAQPEWLGGDYTQFNQQTVTLHHIGAACHSELEQSGCNLGNVLHVPDETTMWQGQSSLVCVCLSQAIFSGGFHFDAYISHNHHLFSSSYSWRFRRMYEENRCVFYNPLTLSHQVCMLV